jgi:hypothetical protein
MSKISGGDAVFDGSTWQCPQCGTTNRVWSRIANDCNRCGYLAQSFTQQLRLLLNQYRDREIHFELDIGKKGRRKMEPHRIVALYESIVHTPEIGFS